VIGGKKRLGLGVALLLLIAFANRLWFITQLPLSGDELFSLQHFIGNGWKVAATDYSSPNNHILNSLLSSGFLQLPLSETVAIRLTSLLASLASILIVFKLVLDAQSARFAFFSAGVWVASLGGLYFGSVSRGYSLVALLSLTAFYALRQISNNTPNTIRWAIVFVVSCALGFLAVPTFLLPFLGFVLAIVVQYLMQRDKKLFTLNGINILLSLGLTALLYLPVLRHNPITSLTDNWIIRNYDLGNFTLERIANHATETLTYFDPLIAALFIPLALIAIWLKKGWKGVFMTQALFMIAISAAYVGLSGTIPPARTLVFITPFIIMAVSEGLYNGYGQVSQLYKKGMMVLIALLPTLVIVNSNKAMYRKAAIMDEAEQLDGLMMTEEVIEIDSTALSIPSPIPSTAGQ